MTEINREDILEAIRTGEIDDADIREAIGGGTRVQKIADGCVLARIVATRAPTTTANKRERNNLAARHGASEQWTTVNNRLFAAGTIKQVSAPMHAVRELLTVGKTENAAGHAANETGANFGLSKWDGTWTVVLRRRLPELEKRVNALRMAQEQGKDSLRKMWSSLRSDAVLELGNMFDPDMWPDEEEWLARWDIKLEHIAFPAADIRIAMDDVARNDIAAQTKANTLKWVQDHLLKGWENFAGVYANTLTFTAAMLGSDAETVQKMNGTKGERKSDRKVPLNPKLIENLRAQSEQAQSIGEVTGDNGLVRVATEALALTEGMDVDTLKKNERMRETLGDNIANLAKQMGRAKEDTKAQADAARQELADKIGEGADDLLDFA